MQLEEYIRQNLSVKGINEETQDYVVKYVFMNKELFGHYMDMEKLVGRIINNLDSSIITNNKEFNKNKSADGVYLSENKTICVKPAKSKGKRDSTIMHELDHCATAEFLDISEEEKEEDFELYSQRKNFPTEEYKQKAREKMEYNYTLAEGKMHISGVDNMRHYYRNGVPLTLLNEGITEYKTHKYDKYLELKKKENLIEKINKKLGIFKVRDGYENAEKVAKLVADIIGEEEMIKMHFENNYQGIREKFNEKTGEELNELTMNLEKLAEKNKVQSKILRNSLTNKIIVKLRSLRLEKRMESIKNKYELLKQENKKNAEFVPKVKVEPINNINHINNLDTKNKDNIR